MDPGGPATTTPTSDDAPAPGVLAAFALPAVRRYVAGQILSNVGTWFQTLALALLVVELTDSTFALALVPALQLLPVLLLSGYGGLLGDRHDPRRLLLITNTAAAAVALVLAAVTAGGGVNVVWVAAVAVVSGGIHAVDRPASQLMPSVLVPPPLLSSALGMNSLIQSAARLAGPALAGAAYSAFGPAWCFAVNGASYLAALVALAAVRERAAGVPVPDDAARPPVRGAVRQGVREAWHRPDLRRVLLVNAAIGLTAFNFLITITAMVEFTFDGDATAVGLAHAANAVGAVVGGVVAPALMIRAGRRLDVACAGFAAALLACALAPDLAAFLLLGPVLGLALALYQVTVLDRVHRLVDRALLGRMMGLVTLGTLGTTPLGSPLIGLLMQATSPRWALGLAAATTLACALWTHPGQRGAAATRVPSHVKVLDGCDGPVPGSARRPATRPGCRWGRRCGSRTTATRSSWVTACSRRPPISPTGTSSPTAPPGRWPPSPSCTRARCRPTP
jgi:MFS family permease